MFKVDPPHHVSFDLEKIPYAFETIEIFVLHPDHLLERTRRHEHDRISEREVENDSGWVGADDDVSIRSNDRVLLHRVDRLKCSCLALLTRHDLEHFSETDHQDQEIVRPLWVEY